MQSHLQGTQARLRRTLTARVVRLSLGLIPESPKTARVRRMRVMIRTYGAEVARSNSRGQIFGEGCKLWDQVATINSSWSLVCGASLTSWGRG